jgi:hypothetical protein
MSAKPDDLAGLVARNFSKAASGFLADVVLDTFRIGSRRR